MCPFGYTLCFLFLKIKSSNKFYINSRIVCIKNIGLPDIFKNYFKKFLNFWYLNFFQNSFWNYYFFNVILKLLLFFNFKNQLNLTICWKRLNFALLQLQVSLYKLSCQNFLIRYKNVLFYLIIFIGHWMVLSVLSIHLETKFTFLLLFVQSDICDISS